MFRYKIVSAFICLLVLSACQTTTFTPIASNVRLATTYEDDSKTTIVGKRIEMNVDLGWFEAAKTADGSYQLTQKGLMEKTSAELQAMGGNDGGGGGGC